MPTHRYASPGEFHLRIAFLITTAHPVGGAQIHVRDLATALYNAGHEVTVLHGGSGDFSEALGQVPFESVRLTSLVRPIRPSKDLQAYRQICRVLSEIRPDLLSTHSSKAGWLGRLAGRALHIPTLFTAHGWAFTEGIPKLEALLYRWAERAVAPLAARIITVSHYDRELALRYRVARPHQVVTVQNGMPDIDPWLQASPELHPPKIVMVARFTPQKDHALLLHALSELRSLEWSLELVGDGNEREGAERLAASLGLGSRVSFLGPRKDVAEILSRAQIFVLASRWEGLPRSILEAMRAGLPVIASDVGGVREAVEHGKTGYLVPRGDGIGLRQALRRLIADPDLRKELGAAGRRRYEEHFTFERMFRETMAVYESVL